MASTLASLALSLVDSTGKNPFGAAYADIRLIYEYFRQQGTGYTTVAGDTTAMLLGWDSRLGGAINSTNYKPSDRSHADCYVFNKAARNIGVGGSYPAFLWTADEDVTSDRTAGDVKDANAFRVAGPPASRKHDVSGTGWTAPDSGFIVGFNHEFQHTLPPSQGYTWSTEMFSAAAEAIGGNADTTGVVDEVPYTWSLLAQRNTLASEGPCGAPSATCVRSMGSNYQARTSFAAYLAYNFRGSDTTATLSAMSDDLLWRWVRSPSRQLNGLRDLLGDGNCGTCSTKTYFHAGGVALDNTSRMALLHHNWRVANYVNKSSLDEGQYGYPPQFGFAPSRQLKAWQEVDPYDTDDLVAIPPEVTLSAMHRTREMALKGNRSFRGNSYPLVLQPYGAEYWVVRSSDSVWASGQDLVVRVTPEDLHSIRTEGVCGSGFGFSEDARLIASVVAYSPPSGSVASARLWEHPEWATRAIAPKWTDVDSVGGALEFVVPSFGDSFKAAVIVLSLAAGPSQHYGIAGLDKYVEALHYRIDLGLRLGPFQDSNPLTLSGSTTEKEDSPTWSPTGAELAYRVDSSSVELIKRKTVGGGAAQTLTAGRFPDWSPRGNLIAFVRDSVSGGSRVWLYDTLTTQASQLTAKSGVAVSPVFSPNGRQIAYARSVADFGPPDAVQAAECVPCGWELRRVDVSGANDTLLHRLYGEFDVRSVRWAPDGRWIYLKKEPTSVTGQPGVDQLWVVASNGTQAFPRSGLLDDALAFDLHRGNGPLLTVQVDHIPRLYICRDQETEELDTTFINMSHQRLALRDTVSNDIQTRFYHTGASFYNPRWSPDGTRITYSSDQNSANISSDRDLFVGQVSFNHAPQFASGLGDVVAHTGKAFGMLINATDSDGESLTYQCPDVYWPSGASFTPATRSFSWPSPGPVCSETFVVFRALDGSGGVANKVVKVTAAIDSVNDLNADLIGDSEVWLFWSAPGDNGSLGRGVEYELRYAQVPLNEANFGVGYPVEGMAAPGVPGAFESQAIDGLASGTTYYIAIRTKDARGNWSIISNLLEVTTMSGPGGGYSAQEIRAPQMGPRPAQTASSRPEGTGDSAAVLAVEMGFSAGAPVWSVRHLNSDETLALGAGDSTSVLLQARDPEGAWFTRARIAATDAAWRFGVRGFHRPGRIVFIGSYGVRQAWNSVELDGLQGAARLITAQHSRLGDVKSGFDTSGTACLELSGSDTLSLRYELQAQDSETAQDWFLVVGPPGSEVSTPARARPGVSEGTRLPMAFALRQNQPNPFSGRTAIRFELPVETRIRLDIFDAQGRLVRTLADGGYPAGFHALEWDQRTDGGKPLGAGVYLYRIQSGSFRDQKKMVLLAR